MSEITIMVAAYVVIAGLVILFLLSIRRGSFPLATGMIDGRVKKDLADFKKNRLIHIGDVSPAEALAAKKATK